VRKRKIILRT